jgi:hypothetical protein
MESFCPIPVVKTSSKPQPERIAMAYLDAGPMISALRSYPESFEYTNGFLHHIPSRHRFQFDPSHTARVDADCACSFLEISRDQQSALYEAFEDWRVSYWRSIEVNREFASHFQSPSWLRQRLISATAWFLRALLRTPRQPEPSKIHLVAAE